MTEDDWDAVERQRREHNARITAAQVAHKRRREQARRQADIDIATIISEPHERSDAETAELEARLARLESGDQ